MGALHGLVGQVDLRGEDCGKPIRNALSAGKVGKPLRTGRLVEDNAYVDVRCVVRLAASLRAEEGEVPDAHAFELGLVGAQAVERGSGINLHNNTMVRNVPQRQRYRPGVLTRARR